MTTRGPIRDHEITTDRFETDHPMTEEITPERPETLAETDVEYPIDIDNPHETADDYSLTESLAVTTAHEIHNGETAFIGVGMSLISGVLAKHTRAPDCQIVTESGYVGSHPPGVVQSISDSILGVDALVATDQMQIFMDNQRGLFDVGIIGAGQIDRYGNTNSTVVIGDGSYDRPKVRLPGSGGSNDIMTSCGRSVVMMRQRRRAFVEELDYVTAPGHLDGPGAREELGFCGGGPDAVVTDMGVFRFDQDTHEMTLRRTHPGVGVDDVRAEVGWDLSVADTVGTTTEPTRGDVAVLRAIDPTDIVLRATDYIYEVGFEEWTERVMANWREFVGDDE